MEEMRFHLRELIQAEAQRIVKHGPVSLECLEDAVTKALQSISYVPLKVRLTPVEGPPRSASIDIEIPNPNLN